MIKRQKICIIGGGLTGLVTAITLAKLNCKIDLIVGNPDKKIKSDQTVAISEYNLNFLNKLNISQYLRKEVWPCSIMKLYSENKNKNFLEVFELNKSENKKKILYMIRNSKLKKLMMDKIKKIKTISVKKNITVNSIFNSGSLKSVKCGSHVARYNLVLVCSGSKSNLVKNYFNHTMINTSYQETAITTILKHNSFKNNIVRQIFLNDKILALLPISNDKTSIVFSVKNDLKKISDNFVKRKIKFYVKDFLKNIKFSTKLEYKDLFFLVRSKYFTDRTLLFGEALHVLHPFVGQGFNMTLRDLESLKKILSKKINLGLDIGSSDILSEFSNETKPRNFMFSVGSDILKSSLFYKESTDSIFKILNRSNFAKNVFFNVADRGLIF